MNKTPENQIENSDTKKFTGKHMLLIMFCFFGVIISVNMGMAYIASKSWTGLVVKSSYVASQHYNDKLIDAAQQKKLGLYSDASYGKDTFFFTVKDKNDKALTLNNVTIKLGRPAFEQDDKVLNFKNLQKESLTLPLSLKKGVWAVEIEAETNQKTYRRHLRIFVNDKQEGLIE